MGITTYAWQRSALHTYTTAGLEIHDGHAAFAVDAPGHCHNAPRIVYDLRLQVARPFSVWCRRALRNRC